MRERYLAGGLKYSDVKKELIELIWNYFAPHRERREYLLAHPQEVCDILEKGALKARAASKPIMEKVREAVGLNYRKF
jgi:tryptophanyl-tRNA synthetase